VIPEPECDTALFVTTLAFNALNGDVPRGVDELPKILHGGQKMAKVQNGEEILPKVSTP